MTHLSPEERMKISLRRHEVEKTGKPFFTTYEDVPKNCFSKSQCKNMKQPVQEDEEPSAYVLNRLWHGYLPLYVRNNDE